MVMAMLMMMTGRCDNDGVGCRSLNPLSVFPAERGEMGFFKHLDNLLTRAVLVPTGGRIGLAGTLCWRERKLVYDCRNCEVEQLCDRRE